MYTRICGRRAREGFQRQVETETCLSCPGDEARASRRREMRGRAGHAAQRARWGRHEPLAWPPVVAHAKHAWPS